MYPDMAGALNRRINALDRRAIFPGGFRRRYFRLNARRRLRTR